MKLLKTAILMAMMLMIAAPFATAGACGADCKEACCEKADIVVYGSARHRLEIDGKSFDKDANMDWMQFMRTRLGVKASRGNSGMVFEVQDSRVLGDTPGTLNGTFTNGNSFENFYYDGPYKNISGYANDFGVRQAYLWHNPCEKGSIKVGRFGVNMHNQRLVGEVNWDQVGRTTEGLMFKRSLNDNVSIIGGALQIAEQNFDNGDDNATDPMFYMLDLNLSEQNVDFFMYLLSGGSDLIRDSDYSMLRSDDVSLMTFGAYSSREFGSNLFYDAMVAMQTGTYEEWATGGDTTDLSGMMLNLEVGMNMESGTTVSALVDYTTGDDSTTDEYEAFNNLLYTGHKWNGYMDFFNGSYGNGDNGLTDIAVRVAHPINETLWVKADAHMFSSTEEYADGKSSIGNELDITLVKKAGSMKIKGGLSFFMANEDWAGADAATAKWAFLQSSFGF